MSENEEVDAMPPEDELDEPVVNPELISPETEEEVSPPPPKEESVPFAPVQSVSPKPGSSNGQKRPAYDDLDDPEVGGTMSPQKKLCRFYFLDECTRADQCYFMHAEFPCKFYYFGYECRDGKKCRLRHGAALDEEMKKILWRHVTTSPANLMQRFPCFPNALLRRNFEDRHSELLQMEQEGLLDEELETSISDTLLGEVIRTVTGNQMVEEKPAEMSELAGILSPEQIACLIKLGIKTKEQLFQLGASSLMDLGYDYDTIINIGKLKESFRRQSIYVEDRGEEAALGDPTTIDVFDTELDTIQPPSASVLSDQELLSILNDDRDGTEIPPESNNTSIATTLEGSFTTPEFSDTSGSANGTHERSQNGVSNGTEQPEKVQLEEELSLLASDASSNGGSKLQFLLFAAVQEKENDPRAKESAARTVEQMCRLDSLVNEGRPEMNVSFGSDSENSNQSGFRLPFKSIIDKYTPATEIDACRGKFVEYKLTPIDIPKPNFEQLRQSFVTEPTCSLDPRLQLMFNIGPTEVRPVNATSETVVIRDPRLKKAIEVAIGSFGMEQNEAEAEKNQEEPTLT